MKENKNFTQRLTELIGGTDVRPFAKKCGVNEASVRNYLKGTSEPTMGNLIKIAQVCNVSVGWLATGEGPKESHATGGVAATISTPRQDARDRLVKQRAEALLGKKSGQTAQQTPQEQTPSAEKASLGGGRDAHAGSRIAFKVLSSKTSYAAALWENLVSFERAVDREVEMENMKEMMAQMMEKIDFLVKENGEIKARLGTSEKRDKSATA